MDPGTGRFISTDPHAGSIYDPVSLHKYLYANANPVMNSDPSGLISLSDLVESMNISTILNMKAQLSMKFIFQAYPKVTNWIILGRGVMDFLADPTWEGFKKAAGHVALGWLASKACKMAPWITVPASIAGAAASANAAYKAYQEGDIFDAVMYGGRVVAMGGMAFYQCFTEGTLVATIVGLKPIEEIKEGDYVLSYNKETGETEYNRVTQVYVREASKLYLIEAGAEVIETTAGHPFFVEGKGYVEASELRAGYPLLLSSGETLPIGNIQTIYLNEPVLVYNMEIEGNHNYFVGEEEVLVHNANYGKKPNKEAKGNVNKSNSNSGNQFENKTTSKFWKSYNKLPNHLKEMANKKFQLFKQNPEHPGLNFEKLTSYDSRYSVRINDQYRAIGELQDGVITWTEIIPHTYNILKK